MIIQPCSEKSKQKLFDEAISTSFGQYLIVDELNTFEAFCQVFNNNTKQILSDDQSKLLMIYNVEVASPPNDDTIIFTYAAPLNLYFPSYIKSAVVIKEAINQIFDEYDDKNKIISIQPNIPFIGQALLIAGFTTFEDNVVENVAMKDGVPIDGYCFIKYRI